MAFQLSPGVNVSEIDLTTVVPSVLTTAGAFAGTFQWGPVDKPILVDSELTLSKVFGKPSANTLSNSAVSFFTAANFLSYGNNLTVVRSVGANARNACANTEAFYQFKNEDSFEDFVYRDNANVAGPFIARYPGKLGDSIAVDVFASANTTAWNLWTYKSYFAGVPGTSAFASSVGGANDEIHIVVSDRTGLITGVANTVLETYGYLSKASDAKKEGATNYYKQVIFNNSKYVYAADPVSYSSTNSSQTTGWGRAASNTNFYQVDSARVTLGNSADDEPTNGNLSTSYDQFKNKDATNISLILTGNASNTVQKYVIDNIARDGASSNTRNDCVVFVSPPLSAVSNVSPVGSETTKVSDWVNSLTYSSYVVADSGWKYQFDKYNNVYRWIPLNGDIAGLCVYTDTVRDPWFSPAGFNRGQIKNAIKLAWNPNKTQRDTIYSLGVNPVVSFPGQGIVLYGDKTLQSKPSAFDRINVRRLFIVLEKAISEAAKFSLFELNDEFTRAQFVALVTPFLRDIQGRRGITDFKVVCDTTNNTPQVIDSNQFVGDIYIKPARSINYIQLNFVAVGTGVDFNTIVGAV